MIARENIIPNWLEELKAGVNCQKMPDPEVFTAVTVQIAKI